MTQHDTKAEAERHVRVLQAYVRKLERIITEYEEASTTRVFDEDFTSFGDLYEDSETEVGE